MNILQILPELNVGGVETGTLDLVRHLVALGHKAVVVSAGGGLVKELVASGGIHYQLPVHKKSVFSIIRNIPKLKEIIEKEKIDIVHARSRAPAWPAYFACRQTSAAFVTTCHGYYRRHPFSYVMGWGKRVIVLSNAIGRHMIDDFGVPYERIKLVPRSVDLKKFRYISPDIKRKDELNVGIIGRITPIKGHFYFVKAMAKVARAVPNLKVWIVGDAPPSKEAYKEQVWVLVRRLGLGSCTQFLGVQRDIPANMAHLDALVLATTTQEAFGRVIIEAQASGVPVVATRVGGVVDIIEDGKNGLLVAAADPQGMAEAVVRICQDKGLARNLAEAAYQKVKECYQVELMARNTLEVYQQARSIFKILIIKLGSLGDVILSTAALRAIRERFPQGYKITCLVGEESKEPLLACPYIDEVLVCDLKNKDKGLAGLWRLGALLRKQNYDLVIDLQNNRASHMLSSLTLALNRYGYGGKKWGFLLNRRVNDDRLPLAPVEHQFRILKLLGIELKDAQLGLWPTEEDQRYMDEFLASQWLSLHSPLIGFNISASQRWLTKNWPLACVVKFCEELGRRDMRVVITGTARDTLLAARVMEGLKVAKPINACGKTTVNQLACLIKRCAVYVSSDSAPLHIAAGVGTPFVAFFGPTDSRRHLPPAKNYAVIKKDLPCSPCYKSKCRTQDCMGLIRPEEVVEAIEKLLGR